MNDSLLFERFGSYFSSVAFSIIGAFSTSAQELLPVNHYEASYFYFFVRDSQGMPVNFELSPHETYTAELWGAKDLRSVIPTIKLEGTIHASHSLLIGEAVQPDPFYFVRGFFQDFFFPRDDFESLNVLAKDNTITNQFSGNHFVRSVASGESLPYIPLSMGFEGLAAIITFQPTTNALEHVVLDADMKSYYFDGNTVKREPASVRPAHFFIAPDVRPHIPSLFVTDFGIGFPKICALGEGIPLTLQRALNPEGPWTDLYTSKVTMDNLYGNLEYVDYQLGLYQKFYRVVVR